MHLSADELQCVPLLESAWEHARDRAGGIRRRPHAKQAPTHSRGLRRLFPTSPSDPSPRRSAALGSGTGTGAGANENAAASVEFERTQQRYAKGAHADTERPIAK